MPWFFKVSIMSKSSKIIVGGCSFTDKNYPQTAKPNPLSFDMWPEVIAKQTGKKVINTAKSGSGNRRIFETVLTELFIHDNVEQVIVGWSEWTRQDFLVKGGWHTVVPRRNDDLDKLTNAKVHNPEVLFDFYQNSFAKDYPAVNQIVNENINRFYSLYCICKERNIKLKMFQMMPLFNRFYRDDDPRLRMYMSLWPRSFLAHPLSLEMEDSFWGWPCLHDLGGYDVLWYLQKRDMWNAVNHLDKHPNEETHKNIAKLIQENL